LNLPVQGPPFQSIPQPTAVVFLNDELGNADQRLEALLLRIVPDWQTPAPDLPSCLSTSRPLVVLSEHFLNNTTSYVGEPHVPAAVEVGQF
jgi:hypothetical protein